MKKLSPHKTGRIGEEIVFNLLSGSKYATGLGEKYNYYDLEWEGIKIEVRTSTYRLRNGFQLAGRASQTGKKDMVYVFVGLEEDKKYFWVMSPPKVNSIYAKISDSIPESEVAKRVKEIWNTPKKQEKKSA